MNKEKTESYKKLTAIALASQFECISFRLQDIFLFQIRVSHCIVQGCISFSD